MSNISGMASRSNLTNTSESNRDWRTMALSTLFATLQVANLPLIAFYRSAHYPKDQKDHSSTVNHFFHKHPWVPDFTSDPSPAVFMLACIVYAFGAGSLYRLNANDRYQSRFLAAGIAAAILISSSNSMVSFPHPMDFKSWVPGTITFSLLLSTAVHNINPRWRTRSAEVPENTDEKYCTMEI